MRELVLATVAAEIKNAFVDEINDPDLIQLLYGGVAYPLGISIGKVQKGAASLIMNRGPGGRPLRVIKGHSQDPKVKQSIGAYFQQNVIIHFMPGMEDEIIYHLRGVIKEDKNISDSIQQGISISFFVKKKQAEQKKLGKVFFAEYFGSRETKYDLLRRSSFGSIRWKEVQPVAPDYFFRPKDISNLDKYSSGIALNELFPHSLVGIKTADDENLISFNPYDTGFDQLIDYRPFDIRHINYDRAKVERDRYDVVKHFIGHQNWGLVINRQVLTDNWSHIQIVRNMIDNRTHYSRRGNPYECPIMTNSAVRGMAWFPLRG